MKVPAILTLFAALPPTIAAQYPNARVSSPTANQPEEVSIAINPITPLNLVAGANLRYVYRKKLILLK